MKKTMETTIYYLGLGSGELRKWVNNQDNWAYHAAYRGFKYTYQVALALQVGSKYLNVGNV